MEQDILKWAIDGGIATLAIFALIFYIKWEGKRQKERDDATAKRQGNRDNIHASERKEWRDESNEHITMMMTMQKESTEVVSRNTSAVEALKEIAKHR